MPLTPFCEVFLRLSFHVETALEVKEGCGLEASISLRVSDAKERPPVLGCGRNLWRLPSGQKYRVPRGAFPALVSEELTLDFGLTSEWQVPES